MRLSWLSIPATSTGGRCSCSPRRQASRTISSLARLMNQLFGLSAIKLTSYKLPLPSFYWRPIRIGGLAVRPTTTSERHNGRG